MQTASLFYSYDSVLELVQVILKRKEWTIFSFNANNGIIKAHSKRHLFHKSRDLDIKVETIDTDITNVTLRINSDSVVDEKTIVDDACAEERLIHTIEKYF